VSGLSRGDIIDYPYRWADEAASDRAPEGAKDRPCCVVLANARTDGQTELFLAAISSKPPLSFQVALEVPEIERRRAGLGKYDRAWVYVDEMNRDVLEQSWYVAADVVPIGAFSTKFVRLVSDQLAQHASRRVINRR
jgi:hypothetical protein